MKYVIVAFLGVLLGAAGAGAVLYYNPLSAGESPPPASTDKTLHYALPGDALHFIAGEGVMLPHLPHGEDSLWEETINQAAVLVIILHDDAGTPVAIATRLMAASSHTDLLLKGAILSDYWLLTFPGEGTLSFRTDANVWPFLKDTLVPVWYLGRPWNGSTHLRPTVGPSPDGGGVMLGGTGRFAAPEGTATESYTLTALDRATVRLAASGELHLRGLDALIASGN